MATLAQPALALADPIDGVSAAVENTRFMMPLVASAAAGCLASVAYYLRWDSASKVIGELVATGQLARSTESEIAEQILTAQRVALISGLAKAVFITPLLVLAVAVVLKITAWVLDRSAPFARCFTAGALAFLPLAVAEVVLALVTIRQVSVSEQQMATLLPSNLAALWPTLPPTAARAAAALDFFRLWGAAVLGLGFSAATGMARPRGLLVGFALYALYAGVFMVGLTGTGGGS